MAVGAVSGARQDAWLELLLPGPELVDERERARALFERLAFWVLPPAHDRVERAGDGPRGDRADTGSTVEREQDAESTAEPSAELLARARGLLARADRDEVFDLIETALGAILGGALGPRSFASFAGDRHGERAAWQGLERFRPRVADLPAAAVTGESARAVAERLVAWLRRDASASDARARRARRWPARLAWAFEGPASGLACWQATYADRDFGRRSIVERASALVDGIELCLACGDPGRALALARASERERALEPRLVQLIGWCEVLAGDVDAGLGWLAEDERRCGRVPGALVRAGGRAPWLARALGVRRRADSTAIDEEGARRASVDDLDGVMSIDGLPRGVRRAVVALQDDAAGELDMVHEHWSPRTPDALRAAAVRDVTRWNALAPVALDRDVLDRDTTDRDATGRDATGRDTTGRDTTIRDVSIRDVSIRDGESAPAPRPLTRRAVEDDGEGGGAEPRGSNSELATPQWAPSLGVPRELLEEALLCGAPRVRLLAPDEDVATAEHPRAVVAVPLPAEGPRGAVWLEFEHRLVPSDAVLRRIAAAFLQPWRDASGGPSLWAAPRHPAAERARDRNGTYDPHRAEFDGIDHRGSTSSGPSSDGPGPGCDALRSTPAAVSDRAPLAAHVEEAVDPSVRPTSGSWSAPTATAPGAVPSRSRPGRSAPVVARSPRSTSVCPQHPATPLEVAGTDPLAAAVRALVDRTSLRRSCRPWWLFVARPPASDIAGDGATRSRAEPVSPAPLGRMRVVASDGRPVSHRARAALLPSFEPGGEFVLDAVERCFRSGAPSLVEHLSAGEGVDPTNRSGCYVPLRASSDAPWSDGAVVAVLAVESTRRRDFRAAFVHELVRRCRDGADALLLADAAAWHAERFGEPLVPEAFLIDDVEQDGREQDGREQDGREQDGGDAEPTDPSAIRSTDPAASLVVAAAARARSNGTLGIVGPTGSGRTHLARCVHFLAGCNGPIAEVHADLEAERVAERLAHGRGTLIVRDLHRAPAPLVEAVRRTDRPTGPLVLWTAHADFLGGGRDDAAEAAQSAGASALDGAALALAPLERARGRIGSIAARLVARAARGLGREPGPELDDSALAALWRGTWSASFGGGLADLDRLAHALVRERRRGRVGATALESVAARLSIALPSRLASRRPPAALLSDAVRTTAMTNGRTNQRRAALYLGWDRDTVRARLREADLA
ncbi:hypothetical protein [Planctomycetes bacterium Pla163]|uniref:hypothetical protein n=1 Tax=Rohdeia mirabilis TaxID=2528008 RepID=UPI00119F92A7